MRARSIFLFLVLVELLSLAGHFFPILNTVGFFLIIAAALVFSLRRLEYGLYFVLAELILGGKGYLFALTVPGALVISLRIGLFVVVMAVWAAQWGLSFRGVRQLADRNDVRFGWSLFALAIVWGVIMGLVHGNNFGDLFLDANGYFYVALVLPFLWGMTQTDTDRKTKMTRNLTVVFFTATTWIAIKTLLAVYIFTHGSNNFIAGNLLPFYHWIRDTGVGEITWLPGNFARVFFQSHVYNLVAFFIMLVLLVQQKRAHFVDRQKMRTLLLLGLNASVIIISLSRSFWVGLIAGLAVLFVFVVAAFRRSASGGSRRGAEAQAKACDYTKPHTIMRLIITTLTAFILATLLLLIVARFPFPRPDASDLSLAAQSRLQNEAASSSRWNLLPPLMTAIKKRPILGSGFGTTVTYISNDPRIREQNPTGEYTTYAFEWGWLDAGLKFGLVGLLAFFGLLGFLVRALYLRSKTEPLYLAGLAVLVALMVLNMFTPYLNHPLGFGILIMLTVAVTKPPLAASTEQVS